MLGFSYMLPSYIPHRIMLEMCTSLNAYFNTRRPIEESWTPFLSRVGFQATHISNSESTSTKYIRHALKSFSKLEDNVYLPYHDVLGTLAQRDASYGYAQQ